MKKTKNDQSTKKTRNMLGRELGSMEDIRTHEDFNNQHPNDLDAGLTKDNSDEDDKKLKTKIMENSIKHTYHIGGMSCGGCVATVQKKLSGADGVTSVTVDLAKKEAEITSSQAIKADKLQEALSNTGYTLSELRDPISL